MRARGCADRSIRGHADFVGRRPGGPVAKQPGAGSTEGGSAHRENRRAWEDWGQVDPLWSIVTASGMDRGNWDTEQFFETGRATIDELWATAAGFGLPCRAATGLDFGCGVGRLSRALGSHVEHVIGLDISATMIERARELHTGQAGLEFRVHGATDLGDFSEGAFDVVCCLLVLQHIPSVTSIESYVGELVRVLAGGGVLMLQLTTALPSPAARSRGGRSWRARLRPRTRLGNFLRAAGVSAATLQRLLRWQPAMPMTPVPDERARALVESAGGRIVWSCPRALGDGEADCLYLVTR